MDINFFGFTRESKDEKKEKKNAERVQDFLNKYKIRSRDLSTTEAKKEKAVDASSQGYSWVQQHVATSENRENRYREYKEMCKVPELNQGLTIYADNATQYDINKNVLEVQSDNNKIIEILNVLFFENLDMNANLWHHVKNMCKFGDEFLEVTVDNPKSPKHIISLERFRHQYRVERIEKNGNLEKFQYVKSKDEMSKDVRDFQPWQIVHLRIEDEEYDPYGRSVFEAGRKLWKRLSLMEDAMLVYRISRAPERRVFYIDVGQLSTKEANKFIEEVKRRFKKKKFVNPHTGEIDEKANPLAVDEDFFIPIRQNSTGTRIETLPDGQNLGEIDDVKYFKDGILRTMGIPIGYLGGAEAGGGYDSKSYLSAQEIQFSRTIERVQKLAVKGLEKIAIIELAFNKIPPEELKNFKVRLTPPSNVDQLMEIEVRNQQFGLITSIRSIENFLPDEWIYKEVLGLSDQEISTIKLQLQMQLQMQAQMQAMVGGEVGFGAAVGGAVGGVGLGLGGPAAGPVAGGPEEAGVGGEAGAEAGAPGAGPGLEVASKQLIAFDGGEWLLENKKDLQKLIKYINLYDKVQKDNNEAKKAFEHKNSLTRMAIEGEFRGLLKAVKTNSKQLTETLKLNNTLENNTKKTKHVKSKKSKNDNSTKSQK